MLLWIGFFPRSLVKPARSDIASAKRRRCISTTFEICVGFGPVSLRAVFNPAELHITEIVKGRAISQLKK